MDAYSIFINDLPTDLTYGQIKAAFWSYQQNEPLQILKKEKYIILTVTKEETVHKVLAEKDAIRLKGKRVSINQARKQFKPTFIHIPPSFHLAPDVVFPPPPPPRIILLPPFFIPAPPPPAPPAPSAYQHPFPEGFSYFCYK